MRTLVPLALIALAVRVDAAQAAKEPPAPAVAPVVTTRPLMLARGDEIFSETFDAGQWQARWGRKGTGWQAGDWTERDGAVHCAPIAAENHHPEMGRTFTDGDSIVQFAFRFDDCDSVVLSIEGNGEHVARLVMRHDSIEIAKYTGIGGTTHGDAIDKAPAKFENGRWYTGVVELMGDEVAAQVDEKWIVYGAMDGLDRAKGHLDLISYGGKAEASFDNITAWKPAGHVADWEKGKKAKLLEMMKKRHP